MAGYVDGFVVPVPTKNLEACGRMARKAARVWREYGALDLIECVADELKPGKITSFPQSGELKKGKAVVFSRVIYKSQVAQTPRQGQRQSHGRPTHHRPHETKKFPSMRRA